MNLTTISYIKECLFVCPKTLFQKWNQNNYSREFQDNSNCKCDQGKAISDVIEFWVSKMIYRDTDIKVYGLWGWSLVYASVSLTMLRSTFVVNAFSSDLETHKTQNFSMVTRRGVAKLSTSPKVTIFYPPVPYPFISDQFPKFNGSNGFVKSANP